MKNFKVTTKLTVNKTLTQTPVNNNFQHNYSNTINYAIYRTK